MVPFVRLQLEAHRAAVGDVRAARTVTAAERAVAVAKSQATAEKTALTDAEKTQTTETDAAKKAEEAKQKP